MENLTNYLDSYLPNEMRDPKNRKLSEEWLRNQSEFSDQVGVDLFSSNHYNITTKLLEKIEDCFIEKVNASECLR